MRRDDLIGAGFDPEPAPEDLPHTSVPLDTAYLLGELKAHGALAPAVLDGLCDHIIGTGADFPDCCSGWWQSAADRPESAS